jgi:hypothetical protein
MRTIPDLETIKKMNLPTHDAILNRAIIAGMALNSRDIQRLHAAVRSIGWAMEHLDKPLASDHHDKGFMDVVVSYYTAECKLKGLNRNE